MEKPKPKTLARRVMELEVDLDVANTRIALLQEDPALRLLTALSDALNDTPSHGAVKKIRGRLHALEVEAAAHLKVFEELARRIDNVVGMNVDTNARLTKYVQAHGLKSKPKSVAKKPAAKKRSRGRR